MYYLINQFYLFQKAYIEILIALAVSTLYLFQILYRHLTQFEAIKYRNCSKRLITSFCHHIFHNPAQCPSSYTTIRSITDASHELNNKFFFDECKTADTCSDIVHLFVPFHSLRERSVFNSRFVSSSHSHPLITHLSAQPQKHTAQSSMLVIYLSAANVYTQYIYFYAHIILITFTKVTI